MAGPRELDQFVRKFVTLWQSGHHAKLFVETEAGDAFVQLQVGLGMANHLEEAAKDLQIEKDTADAEKATEKDMLGDTIPQVDGIANVTVKYNLEIEAFDLCTEEDIVEVLEANFFGTLDESDGVMDDVREILIENLHREKTIEN